MAIVGGKDDEELQNGGSLPGSQPVSSGGGAFVGGSGGQGATTKTAAAPTSSGNFTNLSNYLQANQGSGATTGRAAENVVDQAGTKAGDALTDYTGKADAEISAAGQGLGVDQMKMDQISAGGAKVDPTQMNAITGGVAKVDQKKLDAIKGGNWTTPTTSYTGLTSAKAAGYSGPNEGAVDVSYKGPTSSLVDGKNTISGYGAGAQAAQTAAIGANQNVYDQAANATGGQSGVSALLRGAYQQPNYSAGENGLDAFLSNGTEGGRAALSQAKGVADGTASRYQNINDVLSGKIKSEQGMADQTNQTYAGAIDKATGQTGVVQQQINAAIKGAQGDTTAAKEYAKAIQDAEIAAYRPSQVVFARRPTPAPATATTHQDMNPGDMSPAQAVSIGKQTISDAKNGVDPLAQVINSNLPAPVEKTAEKIQNAVSPAAIGKKLFAAHGGRVPDPEENSGYGRLKNLLR